MSFRKWGTAALALVAPIVFAQTEEAKAHRHSVAAEFKYETSKNEKPQTAEENSTAPVPYRLPPYYVREKEIRLKETEVLTDHGKLLYAKKRFLSPAYQKVFGPLSQVAAYYFNFLSILEGWHPNDAEARVLLEQEERLEHIKELGELTRLEHIGQAREDPTSTKDQSPTAK